MNGVLGLSIIAILIIGTSTFVGINNIAHNETNISLFKKTKEIISTAKKSDISSTAIKNSIKNVYYIPNTNISALNLKSNSFSDDYLLTKLKNAMEFVVTKKHIRNPTCEDLAETGLISINDCLYISGKKGLYVDISNGSIKIDDISQLENTDEIKNFLNVANVISGIDNTDNYEKTTTNSDSLYKVSLSSTITQTLNSNEMIAKNIIKEQVLNDEVTKFSKELDSIENIVKFKEAQDNKDTQDSKDMQDNKDTKVTAYIDLRETINPESPESLKPVDFTKDDTDDNSFKKSFDFNETGRR